MLPRIPDFGEQLDSYLSFLMSHQSLSAVSRKLFEGKNPTYISPNFSFVGEALQIGQVVFKICCTACYIYYPSAQDFGINLFLFYHSCIKSTGFLILSTTLLTILPKTRTCEAILSCLYAFYIGYKNSLLLFEQLRHDIEHDFDRRR
jgi:hypothetical protein